MTPPAPPPARLASATVARIAPFALFIGFLAVGDVAGWFAPAARITATANWLSVARGMAVGLLLIALHRHYIELRSSSAVNTANWALGVSLGVLVFLAWIALDRPLFRVGDASAGLVPLDKDGTLDIGLVALRLIGLVVVVPVMEELFWRSFLMRWLTNSMFLSIEPREVSRSAFVITAVLFALAHDLWLAGLLAGIAYNWIYMRTGNLWIPIAAHAVTNGALAAYILWTGAWHLW